MHLMVAVSQQITSMDRVMSFRLSTQPQRHPEHAALPSMLPELPLLEELMLLTLLLPRCVVELADSRLLKPLPLGRLQVCWLLVVRMGLLVLV